MCSQSGEVSQRPDLAMCKTLSQSSLIEAARETILQQGYLSLVEDQNILKLNSSSACPYMGNNMTVFPWYSWYSFWYPRQCMCVVGKPSLTTDIRRLSLLDTPCVEGLVPRLGFLSSLWNYITRTCCHSHCSVDP